MPYDRITTAALELLAADNLGTRDRLRQAIETKHPGAVDRARHRVSEARFERKFTGDPPAWAKRLVAKYEPQLQTLAWHRSRVGSFHGTCTNGSWISVTVPHDRDPNDSSLKILLLHELAHAEALWDKHGDRFYEVWARYLLEQGLYRQALAKRWSGWRSLRRGAKVVRAKRATKAVKTERAAGSAGHRALSDLLRL